MRLIRSLVFPWMLFFALAVAGFVLAGVKFPQYALHAQPKNETTYFALMGLGSILCLFMNLRSLGSVGLWMSEALPDSIRYGSGRWIFRAIKAVLIAAAFWFAGRLPWTPLIWHAAVFPAVVTICLFVFVWSLLGPILKWSANLAWSRFFSLILSVPVLATVPAMAFLVGETVVNAYRASHADVSFAARDSEADEGPKAVSFKGRVLSIIEDEEMRVYGEWPQGSGENKTLQVDLKTLSPSLARKLPKGPTEKEVALTLEPRAIHETDISSQPDQLNAKEVRPRLRSPKPEVKAAALREVYEFSKSCGDQSKEIQIALDPKGPKDVVYWAAKAVECSDIRSVIGLPKLVQIMLDHPDARVRAAAITSMKKFGDENLRNISYLLVKRMNENEPPEVVEAAAHVLAPLGDDRARWSANRLKSLLDVPKLSQVAAKELIQDYRRDDLVASFVSENLGGSPEARNQAIQMVCLLPSSKRAVAEPHISNIVGAIKTGDPRDPAMHALDCLGRPGFEAVRAELENPKQLDRTIAARALAEMNVKDYPEAIETVKACSRDDNEQVRKWCSQSLGQIGAPALSDILEMLRSRDSKLKEAGRNALRNFEDPNAKDELQQVVRANSGWMANNQNLQIAKAVGTALLELEKKATPDSI